MSTMEPMLGSSLKVCGFCTQLTEEVVTLFPGMIAFLQSFLSTPAIRLPTKLCPDCLKRASNAKKFQEKSLRAFEKLAKNGISEGLVWGREGESLGSGGQEYSRRIHGPLKFPLITLSATDRALAEAHLKPRPSRKYEQFSEAWEVGGDRSEANSDDGEEIFPAVGPFQCEICREVSPTKLLFVTHIKTRHRFSVDPEILRSLELDLKKREERIESSSTAAKTRERGKKRKTSASVKVETEADSDGEKFVPVEKRKYEYRKELLYVDLSGRILPKAAGIYPVCGKTIGNANHMFKHQQTLACMATRKPGETDTGRALVVLVTNFPGVADQPTQSEEEREGEGEEQEEEADEKDRALAEALRAVVTDWQEEEKDLNYNNTVSSSKDQPPVSGSLACN